MKIKLETHLSGPGISIAVGQVLDEKDFAVAQLKRLVEAGLAKETTEAKPATEKATSKRAAPQRATKKTPAREKKGS